MALATHIAFIDFVKVDAGGNIVSKQAPIGHQLNFTTENRVQPDSSNSNTSGHPSIQAYLALENAAGFAFVQMGPNFIVTQHP